MTYMPNDYSSFPIKIFVSLNKITELNIQLPSNFEECLKLDKKEVKEFCTGLKVLKISHCGSAKISTLSFLF